MLLPDVQNDSPRRGLALTRVGVSGVVKPLSIARPSGVRHLVARFDASVDLPATQRGTHMSRNIEVINRLIDEHVRKERGALEDVVEEIAHALLERHEYAAEAEARAQADYFRERRTPHAGTPTLEHYRLGVTSVARRSGATTRTISVEVVGMSACPCAMEGSRAILTARGHDVSSFPTITHNQRNRTTISVEALSPLEVEADMLIDAAEAALSAPTYELLKRGDETALVMQAHQNPRFVEDVVREAFHLLLDKLQHLPDETLVRVRSEAEESIHKHNAYAELTLSLGSVRAQTG